MIQGYKDTEIQRYRDTEMYRDMEHTGYIDTVVEAQIEVHGYR